MSSATCKMPDAQRQKKTEPRSSVITTWWSRTNLPTSRRSSIRHTAKPCSHWWIRTRTNAKPLSVRTDNSNTKAASEGRGKYTVNASAKAITLTSALPIGEKSTTSTLYFENLDDTINSLTYGDTTFLRRH